MKTLAFLGLCTILALVGCGGGTSITVIPGTPVTPVTPASTITVGTSVPGATAGVAYSTQLVATGGTPPYRWSLTRSLPYGFSLSADGVLSGTYPTSLGGVITTFQIEVIDSATTPSATVKDLTLDIFGFGPDQLYTPQVGVAVGAPLDAAGGVEPIQWQVTGTLPPGTALTKNPAATNTRGYEISGKPTLAGTYSFTIVANDSGVPARTQTKSYTMAVEPPLLKFSGSTPLPVAIVGQPYSQTFSLQGGAPPYQYSVSFGGARLPAGLSFNETTGTLSGTPTAPGYSTLYVAVWDGSTPWRQTASINSQLLVSPRPLAGRNDSIATAVPIYPGSYLASISPLRDTSGNMAADQDYYEVTATAGSTLSFSVSNTGPNGALGSLNPVLELVDANGHRLTTCNDPLDDDPPPLIPKDTTPNGFDDPCMNWPGGNSYGGLFARLGLKVPRTSGETTFYVHVFDWRGDARPDMFYTMSYSQQ